MTQFLECDGCGRRVGEFSVWFGEFSKVSVTHGPNVPKEYRVRDYTQDLCPECLNRLNNSLLSKKAEGVPEETRAIPLRGQRLVLAAIDDANLFEDKILVRVEECCSDKKRLCCETKEGLTGILRPNSRRGESIDGKPFFVESLHDGCENLGWVTKVRILSDTPIDSESKVSSPEETKSQEFDRWDHARFHWSVQSSFFALRMTEWLDAVHEYGCPSEQATEAAHRLAGFVSETRRRREDSDPEKESR